MSESTEVTRRRTFAIISHPDAGKTTLTEKLLLFGGAIQLAGEVRAKANRRQTRSDWMAIERQRGISVVTSVMTFNYDGCVFNLLDTPGHEDFSEDTYRTLTAVDSAVMVIDAAKGIEARTRKLFEVCRLRDIPILTFINKMDRETRDPYDLLDEIEKTLALDVSPLTWPVGRGRSLAGLYDIRNSTLLQVGKDAERRKVNGPDDPSIAELLPEHERGAMMEELGLAVEASKPFSRQAFLEGHMTPVLWGSALKEFGVRDLIDAMAELAPSPRAQAAAGREVQADEAHMTGFVFKIQANMDPNHRDRIAFLRVCSGTLKRGMRAKLVRTGKPITLSAPQFFFAQDRVLAEEAYAGDVVGIPNHGVLRIGDTLSDGEDIVFRGVPSFAPGNSPPRQTRRCDEGEKAARGAAANGRGRRRAGVPALRRRRRDRRRRRRAAAGCAGRAAQRRVRPARQLRAQPLRGLPLGVERRQGGDAKVPRRLPLLARPRPRRRPGVHGELCLQSALRAGEVVEDRVHGREGLFAEGGVSDAAATSDGKGKSVIPA